MWKSLHWVRSHCSRQHFSCPGLAHLWPRLPLTILYFLKILHRYAFKCLFVVVCRYTELQLLRDQWSLQDPICQSTGGAALCTAAEVGSNRALLSPDFLHQIICPSGRGGAGEGCYLTFRGGVMWAGAPRRVLDNPRSPQAGAQRPAGVVSGVNDLK